MNSRGSLNRRVVGVIATALFAAGAALAQSSTNLVTTNLVNDGTTTNHLVRIINASGTAGADLTLTVDPNLTNALLAAQTPLLSDFAISAAWCPDNVELLGTNYTATADVLPAANAPQNCVGVMGWIDPAAGTGIAFRLVPGDVAGSLQVAAIDFTAPTGDLNDSYTNLFNLDGTPAYGAVGSAWSDLAGYSPTNFATLSVTFSVPTAADLAVLTNATAHITARAFQGADAQQNPIQIGETVELLTARPPPGTNTFGYYANWGTFFVPGDVIGDLRNLTIIGNVSLPNQPPLVALASPADNATFTAPATVTLTADASDPDGSVTRVDFYVDTNLVGTVTSVPFSVTLTNLAAGSYALTAKATDNRDASTVSTPVTITVSTPGTAATLTNPQPLPSAANFQNFQFTLNGTAGATYVVDASTNLTAWTPVATNTLSGPAGVVSFPVPAGAGFVAYRVHSTGSTPPTVQVTSITLLPAPNNFQQFQFTTSGLGGLNYEIDGSTDLVKWTSLTNGIGLGAVQTFTFPRSTVSNYEFFRLLVSP